MEHERLLQPGARQSHTRPHSPPAGAYPHGDPGRLVGADQEPDRASAAAERPGADAGPWCGAIDGRGHRCGCGVCRCGSRRLVLRERRRVRRTGPQLNPARDRWRPRAVEDEQHVPAGWRDGGRSGHPHVEALAGDAAEHRQLDVALVHVDPVGHGAGSDEDGSPGRPAGRLADGDACVVAPRGGARAARDRRTRSSLGAVEQVRRLVDLGLVERLARRRSPADERIRLVVHVPVVVPGREDPPIREKRRDGVIGAPLPLRRPDRPGMAARLQQLDVLELLVTARVAVQRRR